MNDPRRLLDEGADDFERALLSAAERDVGSQRAAARCVAAVGATALATKTAGASGVLSSLSALKAGLVGVALGLVVSGASVVLGSAGPSASGEGGAQALSSARVSAKNAAREVRSDTAIPHENAEEPDAGAHEAEVREAQARTPARPAPTANTDRAQQPTSPTVQAPDRALEREVLWLDRARQALANSDARGASSALDSYSREFPRGALQPEADFLRVRALLGEGRRAEAGALGRRLLARHPAAAHAQKLRELLGPEQL